MSAQRAHAVLAAFAALLSRQLPREIAERLQTGGTPTAADIAAAAAAGRAVMAARPALAPELARLFLADRGSFNARVREMLGGILRSGRYPGPGASPQASDPTPEGATFTLDEADRADIATPPT